MFKNFFKNQNKVDFIVITGKKKLQFLNEIDERGIKRYARLINLKNKIENNFNNIGIKNNDSIDSVTTNNLINRLDAITDEFLHYYKALLQHQELINHNEMKNLDKEIHNIEENIKCKTSDKYKTALKKRLFVLKKRKDKFFKNIENIDVLKTQILTIEDIFKLMYEQSISIKNPEQIISQVQYLIEDIKIADETISEINKL